MPIPRRELAALPPIAVVWAPAGKARGTAAGDVIVVRGGGAHLRRVASWKSGIPGENRSYGAFDVHWSPGRRSLGVSLAVWQSDPNAKIATISSIDGIVTELTEGAWGDRFVEWSHDGTHVLYAGSSPDDGSFTVLLSIPAEGGKPIEQAVEATRRLRRRDVFSIYPSPDGNSLAGFDRNGILITKVTGSRVVRLAKGDFEGGLIWAPDSRRILVNRSFFGPSVISAEGGGEHLLKGNGCCEAVAWSPDGRKILVIREVSDRAWTELWVMDADGGRLTRLSFNRPHWSVLAADWDTPHP